VQIMSAGTGVEHSEQNGSRQDDVNFLQIWVFPKQKNIAPRYDQKKFERNARQNKWQTLVSPTQEEESLWINQDAWFLRSEIGKGQRVPYTLHKENQGVYVFVIDGSITVNGQVLNKRDGYGISGTHTVDIVANENADVLLIEVPMQVN
jgi:quercetin 2,3-dioxygenase